MPLHETAIKRAEIVRELAYSMKEEYIGVWLGTPNLAYPFLGISPDDLIESGRWEKVMLVARWRKQVLRSAKIIGEEV